MTPDNDPKAEGGKRPGVLRRFAGNRTRAMRKLVNTPSVFGEGGRAALWSNWMDTLLGSTRVLMNRAEQAIPPGTPYAEVERRWEIAAAADRNRVLRYLKIERFAWVLLALWGITQGAMAIGETSSFIIWSRLLGGGLLALVSVMRFGILTWRIEVIRHKRWVTFPLWLRGH